MRVETAVNVHIGTELDVRKLELFGNKKDITKHVGLALTGSLAVDEDRPVLGAEQSAE